MKRTGMPLKLYLPVLLCSTFAMVCLSAGSGFCVGVEVVCGGTIAAWRQDPHMRQYLNDYECTCSNGNSSPPVCRSRNTGAETSGGGGGGGKRAPSDEQIVLKEIQNHVDQMFKVNWQAYMKYQQTGIQNAHQINQTQQATIRSEEERKQKAAREEAALREKSAMEVHTELLGMPPAGGDSPILDITSALDGDVRRKQLAECPGIAEKIARYENGIRHIDEVMARNDRMIREAEGDGKKAGEELSKVSAEATAETLSMGLKSFVQTQKNLQNMKNALDKLGKGGGAGELSFEQIAQAKKWLDKGLTHGGNVMDLTEKSIEYYKKTSLRGNGAIAASPYGENLKIVLKDFNDKFMYDAGGWEFIGEHLAEAGGGIAGEIAFKAAVAGIKATAAGIGMKISKEQMRGFNENQDKMALERFRLEQRMAALNASFVNNRCPNRN